MRYEVRLFNLDDYPVKGIKFVSVTNYKTPISSISGSFYLPQSNIGDLGGHSNILVFNDNFSYGMENPKIIFFISNSYWKYSIDCTLYRNGIYYEVKALEIVKNSEKIPIENNGLVKIDNMASSTNTDDWTKTK